ncbi:MAG TPA: glycosyltransferase family 2 protein [Bacteroidota bacterium]|nr:glycosyltransferase family 2 protein [Bacteroidota bacterium]
MNFAVIIPAYNAGSSLTALLDRSRQVQAPTDTIVVDDGSTDGTAGLAHAAGVIVCAHEKNRGKGAALSTGFACALARGYEAVITMDSDLQHQPEDIPRFIRAHQDTGADIIIGSRLHSLKGMPYHRRLSNIITTAMVRARTGAAVEDSQSGFRFIHARALRLVETTSQGFEAETEFIIRAALKGCSFSAIPIDTIYAGEKSTMTHWQTTVRFISVLLTDY